MAWATSSAGRHRVGERSRGDAEPAQPPDAGGGGERHAAPDAQAAGPDGEDPVPHVRDVGRRGDVEVDPAADDARRYHPQRDVADEVGVAAERAPPAAGDQDGQGDPDDVAERVEKRMSSGPTWKLLIGGLGRYRGSALVTCDMRQRLPLGARRTDTGSFCLRSILAGTLVARGAAFLPSGEIRLRATDGARHLMSAGAGGAARSAVPGPAGAGSAAADPEQAALRARRHGAAERDRRRRRGAEPPCSG